VGIGEEEAGGDEGLLTRERERKRGNEGGRKRESARPALAEGAWYAHTRKEVRVWAYPRLRRGGLRKTSLLPLPDAP